MTDARNVKVTTQDINSLSEKLHAFKQQLPAGEQNVLEWLLDRGPRAPEEKADALKASGTEAPRPAAASAKVVAAPRASEFNKALGISQFSKTHPGAVAAGSSIGVTGTVMF